MSIYAENVRVSKSLADKVNSVLYSVQRISGSDCALATVEYTDGNIVAKNWDVNGEEEYALKMYLGVALEDSGMRNHVPLILDGVDVYVKNKITVEINGETITHILDENSTDEYVMVSVREAFVRTVDFYDRLNKRFNEGLAIYEGEPLEDLHILFPVTEQDMQNAPIIYMPTFTPLLKGTLKLISKFYGELAKYKQEHDVQLSMSQTRIIVDGAEMFWIIKNNRFKVTRIEKTKHTTEISKLMANFNRSL